MQKAPLATFPGLLILTLAVAPNVAAQVFAHVSAQRLVVTPPMSEPYFVGLKSFMASPAATSLLAGNPQLRPLFLAVVGPPKFKTLEALGLLAAKLPADFAVRIKAAPTSDSMALAEEVAKAYAASQSEVVAEIDAHVRLALYESLSGGDRFSSLGTMISDLKSYALYGEKARSLVALYEQDMAVARTWELMVPDDIRKNKRYDIARGRFMNRIWDHKYPRSDLAATPDHGPAPTAPSLANSGARSQTDGDLKQFSMPAQWKLKKPASKTRAGLAALLKAEQGGGRCRRSLIRPAPKLARH